MKVTVFFLFLDIQGREDNLSTHLSTKKGADLDPPMKSEGKSNPKKILKIVKKFDLKFIKSRKAQ